jgi:hypothetical protein
MTAEKHYTTKYAGISSEQLYLAKNKIELILLIKYISHKKDY